MNNFGSRCGVSQIGLPELLIASQILPWEVYASERLNVRNGICLSRLHDAAFDRGLITFDDAIWPDPVFLAAHRQKWNA
jgi:putative restriction endonuclease